jgi:16S rRNA (uracil1498-N3)-methyltransferase
MIEELYYDRAAAGGMHRLNAEESVHITRVLRKKTGDLIHLTNGLGDLYLAEIIEASPKGCLLSLSRVSELEPQRNYKLRMAVAPTKNISRFEWFLEKAVELGVDELIPLLTEHSERRNINIPRLEKIAVSAMKQSFKLALPEISNPIGLMEALDRLSDGPIFMARLDEDEVPHLADALGNESALGILIGPEGDFSHREKSLALAAGALQVHLGPSRLRTETAALAACHTVHLIRRK